VHAHKRERERLKFNPKKLKKVAEYVKKKELKGNIGEFAFSSRSMGCILLRR